MKSNPFDGITRPSSPTLSDIQRRMAELTGAEPSILWSAIPESERLPEAESRDESTLEETADEDSMQEQT